LNDFDLLAGGTFAVVDYVWHAAWEKMDKDIKLKNSAVVRMGVVLFY